MKTHNYFLIIITACLFYLTSALSACSTGKFQNDKWSIEYDSQNKDVDIYVSSKLIFKNIFASFKLGDSLITTKDYGEPTFAKWEFHDVSGHGEKFTLTYTDRNLPKLTQIFYTYPDRDYLLTEIYLQDDSEISSNYLAPINMVDMLTLLPDCKTNRALFVPFDNDCFIRYKSNPITFKKLLSYEVTAVFNNDSRNGMVLGSVEHDNWKSGIEMQNSSHHNIDRISCFNGIADETTRDSKEHGSLSGKIIKSSKMLLGYFQDWRDGLDTYARVNASIQPPKEWNKAVPFGWNSWGTLQFDLNYNNAVEVSDFFKNKLQPNGFFNDDKLVYVGLDAGWNAFSENELKNFVDRCHKNGQKAGVYMAPFADFSHNPTAYFNISDSLKNSDVYLLCNGSPQELDGAYSFDPTHPAVESKIKTTSDLLHRAGFDYIKIDFLSHSSMEADRWYNPRIQTGIQAYNYALGILDKYLGDMYMNLSIAPLFPAQYAQSRRISCDSWNTIKDTQYTMNSLSYGWWLDKVYQFNDPDHVVLRDATEGENRARITSAVITGLLIIGDDFSIDGKKDVKERALSLLTNNEVNSLANGVSFRPVEGSSDYAENQFVRKENDGSICYVVFNYNKHPLKVTVNLSRLGLDPQKSYRVKELWSKREFTVDSNSELVVPKKDVMIFKIEP